MKRVERPKIEQLSTGEQFHLVDMNLFEVIEGKSEPSSIRFEVPDTENNKRVFEYVEDRNLLVFEGQYYILLVNKLNELGFKDCDAIQVGAELSRQTQEQKITGYLSIEEGLAHTFKGSNFKYMNQCSPKNQVHFENFGGANRMSMIQNLIKRYDIECIFDNMTVIFADRIGKTTDKLYKFGYNVNAIEKTTDDSDCSFSVLLLGHTPSQEEGGGSQFQYYYESPLKYQMPELIRHRQAENIEDDKIKDKETALKRCKEAVNDIPIVSITVDHKEASFDDTNEPKVGDKAILQHHKYNMDFDVRVVKRRRYPFEQTPNVYEFSNKRDELVDRTEEQKKWTSDILSVVKELDKKLLEQSNDYSDRLNKITEEKVEDAKKESEAAKELAELVKENQKNFQTTIVESKVPPTDHLEPGKSLWLDISKGKPGILKKWNGKTWEPIIADVEAIKNETLQQVNEDIKTTRQDLDKKVEKLQRDIGTSVNTQIREVQTNLSEKVATVKKDTETISGEILNIQKDINSKVDSNFVKEQIKDKADKSGVFTKDEINNGFIGKQIYETDKQGNVKKFQEISTTVEQTNESIKHLATKESVTDLGNNLTQVSKVANEAKQTADGNARTISQVDSKVSQTATDFNKKTTAIEETVNGVSTKVTNIQTEQGKISERVTKTEQTAEGFKKSIESLNTANGTTSNRLNKVEETVEGTKQTISDIKSEAASLKKTTNEIKQTADGTKQTLTELQTKVENTKINVRNLIRYSGDFAKGWNRFQNVSELKVVDDARFGKILEAQCDALTTSRNPAISNSTIPVEVGNEYTLAFWIKRETRGTISQLLKFRDAKGTESNPIAGIDTNIEANTWHFYKQTFTVPANVKELYITPRIITSEASKKFWIAQPLLTEGNTDTGWQPAPEDQVTSEEFSKKTVEIEQNINGIKNTVSSVQKEQGTISQRVTNAEQTAVGFKQSIESLTKKDGEISNKLNTVESTVEGTKKTISDVQSDTSALKKTTTEMKEQAGKISEKLTSVETKVNNDKAGGRNLLLDSDVKYEKNDYLINPYMLSENFSVGEEYTFVIKGSVPQGQKFGIWQNGGSNNAGYATNVYANGVTYVTFKAVATTSGNERKLTLYNYPSSTTKSVVEWVALYKGNKPQDWTPAPENQVTNAEFTKRTAEIEKSVDGVKTTVTGIQNSQSGFEKRMTSVEQTASGLSTSVSQLAQTTTNQGKQITDANSKLDQQAKLIEAKVNIKQVEDYVGGFQIPALKNTVDKNREEALKQIADKVATADYNKKTTEIDNRLKINEEGIGLSAKKTEVYTRVEANGTFATTAYVKTMEARIDVAERSINLSVKEGNVIAAINISKETIQLDAKRINLRGAVTAESIAGKLLEGLTIRAIDPNDRNKKAEMTASGRIFSEWKTTPDPANFNTARFETGLEGGALFAKTFGSDGKEKYRGEITALGASFDMGNDNSNYGASGFTVMDNGQTKSISARAYVQHLDWKPAIQIDQPRQGWHTSITSTGIEWEGRKYRIEGAPNGIFMYENSTQMVRYSTSNADIDIGFNYVTLRSGTWGNYYLQVMDGGKTRHNGIIASEFRNSSQRKIKTGIKDLQFSPLEVVLQAEVKEYFYKCDMEELYKMRSNRKEGEILPTTKDIEVHYGVIADDAPIQLANNDRTGVDVYGLASVTMAGLKEHVIETGERFNKIEKVIIDETNSKRRTLRKSGGRTIKRSQSREKYLSSKNNRTRCGKSKVTR
ncbi:phage tail protein [Bacillus pretiosus]|uniref:phage tail protein n=1 Tax=Bacillus pretiosus TaxID=2983392 RepID=UPI003D65A662